MSFDFKKYVKSVSDAELKMLIDKYNDHIKYSNGIISKAKYLKKVSDFNSDHILQKQKEFIKIHRSKIEIIKEELLKRKDK